MSEKMRDYLRNSLVSPESRQELYGYIDDALNRFLMTLEMVPEGEGKILELGANPYFFTLLLKKYRKYNLELANYFEGRDTEGTQTIHNVKYGEEHVFHYKEFNVEKNVFPYPDGEFDGVLFCEIIEHLVSDPVFTLSEIYRILKPEGFLILTTPNSARWENIKKLLKGENLYDPYSAYGVYGRHNREYTAWELADILSNTGFRVKRLFTKNIHSKPFVSLDNLLSRRYGETIFLLAEKGGEFTWYFPDNLYRSGIPEIPKEKYAHIIVMGRNDRVQLGQGWYCQEDWGRKIGKVRWSGKSAEAYVRLKGDESRLIIEALTTPHDFLKDRVLTVKVAAIEGPDKPFDEMTVGLKKKGWTEISLPLSLSCRDTVRVLLEVSEPFVPKSCGTGQDDRELGIAVKRIAAV